MMGTEGCKRAGPLGTLWQLLNNLRLDEWCSTNKYRYTQMNRYIHLERYLLRSQETKKGSQTGQKSTEELLQWDSSQQLLEGLPTGGSSKDSELTFSRVMEGISFDGSRVTPGPAEAPLTPFGKC